MCYAELPELQHTERLAEANRRWAELKNTPDAAEFQQIVNLMPKPDPSSFTTEETKAFVGRKHKYLLKLVTVICIILIV